MAGKNDFIKETEKQALTWYEDKPNQINTTSASSCCATINANVAPVLPPPIIDTFFLDICVASLGNFTSIVAHEKHFLYDIA